MASISQSHFIRGSLDYTVGSSSSTARTSRTFASDFPHVKRSVVGSLKIRETNQGNQVTKDAKLIQTLDRSSITFPSNVPSESTSSFREAEIPDLFPETLETDDLWLQIRTEARQMSEDEPTLASFLYSTILSHRSLERSLAFHLANKLSSSTFLSTHLFTLITDAFMNDEDIRDAIRKDMISVKERDAACSSYSQCMLNFKGYLAIQTHRIAHKLWQQSRHGLALALQSRVSEVFHVDIHPAAKFGKGVMFDHATGIVIGETAEIGNNVSILHHVTLGGTGKTSGDRHPKVKDGVLIGAGATILGNVIIGEGSKIGAGSMVLADIPPYSTAVGNPARLIGKKGNPNSLKEQASQTMDQTSFIGQWSDYVI